MPKAMKFVMEVMVMATPAWDIVAPILSVIDLDFSCSEIIRTFHLFYSVDQRKVDSQWTAIKYN